MSANAWGAIAQAASSVFSSGMQAYQNHRDRQFAKEMWNDENGYNLPANQVQRLKDANLNPAMMYGNGTVANTAHSVNTPTSKPIPQLDIGGAVNTYFDTQVKSANLNNLKAQEENIRADTELKRTQNANTLTNIDLSNFNLGQKKRLADGQAQVLEQQIRTLNNKNVEQEFINSNLSQNQQLAVKKAYSDLATAKSSRDTAVLDRALKQAELNLNKVGLTKSDNVVARMLTQFSLTEKGKKVKEQFKNTNNWLEEKGKQIKKWFK